MSASLRHDEGLTHIAWHILALLGYTWLLILYDFVILQDLGGASDLGRHEPLHAICAVIILFACFRQTNYIYNRYRLLRFLSEGH